MICDVYIVLCTVVKECATTGCAVISDFYLSACIKWSYGCSVRMLLTVSGRSGESEHVPGDW